MTKIQKILSLVIFFSLCLSIFIYICTRPSKSTLIWEKYSNNEVGFSILYPKTILNNDFLIHSGDTGKEFSAVFQFPSGRQITIYSITPDFTVAREANMGETFGFSEYNGKYYSDANHLYEINPSDIWAINKDKDKALVLYEDEFNKNPSGFLYIPELLVIANNPNKSYPGIGFEINKHKAINQLSKDEIAIVKQMVSSIEYIK
ncbi:MAG: hypothetical protein WC666_04145 [Candidatus Paceibacterota bacterium]|jgi:hypothetical protein